MVELRKELRPASFRGLDFMIVDDDVSTGRRIVTHEFPGKDEPYHEDLGQMPFALSIRGVIIGDGFVARANALEKAFRQDGIGILIHPHYGEVQVVVKDMRRQHSINEIGMVEFSITVERSSATGGISILNDTARKLTSASDSMFDLAEKDYLGSLAADLFPNYVSADSVSRISSYVSLARDTFRFNGLTAFGVLANFSTYGGDMAEQLSALFRNVISTVKPQTVPIVGTYAETLPIANPVKVIRTLTTVANADVDATIEPSTPSRAAIVQNSQAISTLVKTQALAAAGAVARYADYDSREQAIETRDLLSDSLYKLRDRQLIAGQTPAWRASSALMVALTEDINERIGRLPRTVKVQGNTVRPSLAIANRLYGDDPTVVFSRADDIVKRNRIPHPGFIGVKPLEVLVDA